MLADLLRLILTQLLWTSLDRPSPRQVLSTLEVVSSLQALESAFGRELHRT